MSVKMKFLGISGFLFLFLFFFFSVFIFFFFLRNRLQPFDSGDEMLPLQGFKCLEAKKGPCRRSIRSPSNRHKCEGEKNRIEL